MERLLFSIKWVLDEGCPGGWAPVELIQGKFIPVKGIRNPERWTFVKVIPGKQARVKNPSGIAVFIKLTPMEVVNW